jgi:hypothetical protein
LGELDQPRVDGCAAFDLSSEFLGDLHSTRAAVRPHHKKAGPSRRPPSCPVAQADFELQKPIPGW